MAVSSDQCSDKNVATVTRGERADLDTIHVMSPWSACKQLIFLLFERVPKHKWCSNL